MKLVVLYSVLLMLCMAAMVAGITSFQQVLLLVLVVVFFTVLVKGAIDGVRTQRLRGKDRVPSP